MMSFVNDAIHISVKSRDTSIPTILNAHHTQCHVCYDLLDDFSLLLVILVVDDVLQQPQPYHTIQYTLSSLTSPLRLPSKYCEPGAGLGLDSVEAG